MSYVGHYNFDVCLSVGAKELSPLRVGDTVTINTVPLIVANHIELKNKTHTISFIEKHPVIKSSSVILDFDHYHDDWLPFRFKFGLCMERFDYNSIYTVTHAQTEVPMIVHPLTKLQLEGAWEYFKDPSFRKFITESGEPVSYWTSTVTKDPEKYYCVNKDGVIVSENATTKLAYRFGFTLLYCNGPTNVRTYHIDNKLIR